MISIGVGEVGGLLDDVIDDDDNEPVRKEAKKTSKSAWGKVR
jgi:hypothetical protein